MQRQHGLGWIRTGVQPEWEQGVGLLYCIGPIMTLQAARNKTLPSDHLKRVSSETGADRTIQTGCRP